MMVREEVDALALGVLHELDRIDPDTLYMLAEGLGLARSSWYLPVWYAAGDRMAGDEYGDLALSSTRLALGDLARDHELRERLGESQAGFWRAAAAAAGEVSSSGGYELS